ncbi:uncharacterized protein [Diadema setosum]
MLKSFGTKMGTRNTVAVDQLKFRKGSFPRLGVRVSMRWHRKLWKGTVTAVYRGENSESSSDDGNTSTVDSSDKDDTSDYDDDDNIYRAKLVGIKKDISYIEGAPLDPSQQNVSSDQLLNVAITKDMDCIHEIPIPELNNEVPSDPSQQNVRSDQLLIVGIKKDINCLPEIPMLVLNNEGAPSDSSQQNVRSDQLLTVGITKDMDCIQEIPMLVLNNEAPSDPSRRMSSLTNFSLLASPRTWTAFKRYQYTLCTRIEQ